MGANTFRGVFPGRHANGRANHATAEGRAVYRPVGSEMQGMAGSRCRRVIGPWRRGASHCWSPGPMTARHQPRHRGGANDFRKAYTVLADWRQAFVVHRVALWLTL